MNRIMNMKEIWNYKHNESILGIEIGDINGNGKAEIITYSKTGTLLIFSLEGNLLLKESITKNSAIWCSKIHDIDNDGQDELILGGIDGLLRVFKSNITENSFNLVPLWAHQFGASISGIIINDINDNKKVEIIAYSLDKTIRVLNAEDGSLIWGQNFQNGIGDAIVWTDKELNKKEIAVCGNDGTLRIFNIKNGELLWFKQFSDKLRCVSYFNSSDGPLILCGGDDKCLHVINRKSQEEIKSLEFENYIWKCCTYTSGMLNKALISSYSFDYLENSIPIQNIEFTSKIICIDSKLKKLWEIKSKNIETLEIIEKNEKKSVILGTTKGEILILGDSTEKVKFEVNKNSCVNSIQYYKKENFIFTCHDDGAIFANLFLDKTN